MQDAAPILEGIRVLDFGSFVAGPAAATIMSDFGADVIKIEPPGIGDTYRYLPMTTAMPDCDLNYSWLHVARNKRSLALDLKKPGARDPFERLVAECDVFLTNLPPNVQERLNIRYDDLRPLNERMIHASLTAYGEQGEEASKPGYDATSWWARSGLMEYTRAQGASRTVMPPAAGDMVTSMGMLSSILMALYRRERTGKGARVHTSLLANGIWSNAVALQAELCGVEVFDPEKPEVSPQTLVNHYECRDGRAFIVAVLQSNASWESFACAIGRPDLVTDPRYETPAGRQENLAGLTAELDAVFAEKDWPEWRQLLLENRVTTGPVNRNCDVISDPQVLANNMLVDLDLPGARSVKTVDSPIWVEGAVKVKPRRAPEVGEHTEQVLREAGCSDADIAALRAAGAII